MAENIADDDSINSRNPEIDGANVLKFSHNDPPPLLSKYGKWHEGEGMTRS